MRRAGDRERLMLALGACAGLRRAEIAQCRGDALERDLDGWSLRVVGKGGRVRRVPLSDDLAEQVQARGTGWTFQGQMRAGRAIHGDRSAGHLSAGRVGELVSELLPDGWTTHTLRHRFASAAYRADRDIRAVQELLGHVSVATTQVYTAVPDDAKRRAALAAGIAA
nr:tyrosine-type recombinase/integrase [Tsukamurella pulmonis]